MPNHHVPFKTFKSDFWLFNSISLIRLSLKVILKIKEFVKRGGGFYIYLCL